MRAFLLAPIFVAAVFVLAVSDRDSGLPKWLQVRSELRESTSRIALLREEIETLEVEVEALRSDPFAIERAIREDLELAKPGETVVRFPSRGSSPGSRLH